MSDNFQRSMFTWLYEHMSANVTAQLTMLTKRRQYDGHDVEDLAQVVWERVWTKLPSFEPRQNLSVDEALRGWVRRIAYNAAIDAIRRQRLHTSIVGVWSDDHDVIASDTDDPHRRAVSADIMAIVNEAIASMTEHQAKCFVAVMRGVPGKTCARMAGISHQAVRTAVMRGRLVAREKLRARGFEPHAGD